MSSKKDIQKFIEKYYLNGLIDKVKMSSNNKKTFLRAITEDRALMSIIEWKGDFPDGELAIYDNAQLLKLLSLYDENDDSFKFEFIEQGNNFNKIKISGKDGIIVEYILSDPIIIPEIPEFNEPNEWDMKIEMNQKDIQLFIKSRTALQSANLLFIGENNFTIGNSDYGTNKIDLNVKVKKLSDNSFIPLKYNLDYFKEIISTLQDNVTIYILYKGLMKVSWNDDNLNCVYFLAPLNIGD